MSRCDALVAGAGPAGSMAALELARSGASVLLVERQPFPRWKVCGACLSPGGLATLAAAGLGHVPRDAGAVPLERMRLFSAGREATVPLLGSMALSRPALDQALVAAAVEAGATFLGETRAEVGYAGPDARSVRLVRDGHAEVIEARAVIDATGLRGAPADRRSAPSRPAPPARVVSGSRIGLGATLAATACDVPTGELHMVVARRGYVGLVRLEDGSLNVGAAVDAKALADQTPAGIVAEVLAEARRPALGGTLLHGWRGTPPLTRLAPVAGEERLLRVGDAAGYVEPFTGEGMCWALAAGRAAGTLARAGMRTWDRDVTGSWAAYQRDAGARSRRLCRTLAWGLRRPLLVRGAVHALARAPVLAAPLVRRAAMPPGRR